ncbi:AraC family transcriptional regulator [Luteibacter rhizovicinus]|uniref:AraC family transcriptional regulator n=2 Tax=Luteibacter rhizovicinus TaxID=242606 RepID=A0A4R3Z1H1_9GAMM|nr:AraC family transcriptional regulator [Luteibacter rhizovicinus]
MPRIPHTPQSVLSPGANLPWHVHVHAYATLVLEGGYEEAGECGRWHVQAGDVLFHAPFSTHANQTAARGARLLNLTIPDSVRQSTCGKVDDMDLLVRLAERDPLEATAALMLNWQPARSKLLDAPDLLAQALSDPDAMGVQAWSRQQGVSRETAFRWFQSAYGVAPTRYRIEARARRTWRMIVEGTDDLADIAAWAGYADQAHMTRDIKAFTGRAPGAWRKRRPATFVQDLGRE